MRLLRAAFPIIAVVAAASVFQPPPRTGPLGTVLQSESIDPSTMAILRRACLDCHSQQTRRPWYGYLAPLSWLIERDVRNARNALNFSQWPKYGAARGAILELARDRLSKGRMPPQRYVALHPEAKLSPSEKQQLMAWFRQASAARLQAQPKQDN